MALDSRISLLGQQPKVSQAINIFENALMNNQTRDIRQQQADQQTLLNPFQVQQAQQGVEQGQQALNQNRQQQRLVSVHQTGQRLKPFLESGDIQGAQQFLLDNISSIQSRIEQGSNEDVTESMEALSKLQSGDTQGLLGDINAVAGLVNQTAGRGKSAGQREFENLLRIVEDPNSSQVQKDSANRALGNKARATGAAAKTVDVGGVPHIFDPVKQTLVPAVIGGADVTTETVSSSEAGIAGAVTAAQETAKIAPELRKQTQKQNSQRISELTRSEKARGSSVNKARRFLKAFESSAQSGASRSALSFLPGVFTTQAQFDEQFNAFAEVAARQQLKASGETRPTDADVEGMKRAIFGVGRDEVTNINLLKEFINDQGILDIELDELRDAKSLGKLSTFTGNQASKKELSGFTDFADTSDEDLFN